MTHMLLVPNLLFIGNGTSECCDYLSQIGLIFLNYLLRAGMGSPAVEEERCIERFIGCMAVKSIFE